MKLLLTSKGITNKSIEKEFVRLLDKNLDKSTIGYIPTAGLFSANDKKWFVDEMLTFRNLEPKEFIIIDFNLLERKEILTRIDRCDALAFSGGDSSVLLHAIDKKDLRDELYKFSQTKLYCGVSASSHIVSKDLTLSNKEKIECYYNTTGYRSDKALGWVDFYVRAHYLEERYPDLTEDYLQEQANNIRGEIYGIDDQSAISIEDSKIEIISEDKAKLFTPRY